MLLMFKSGANVPLFVQTNNYLPVFIAFFNVI